MLNYFYCSLTQFSLHSLFSHLNTFFSRYYDKGDFVTLRRYKKDFRRMIKTTPSDFRLQTSNFRLHFALQSLPLTVLQFLKTIFCVIVTVLQFWKAKSHITTVAFVDLIVGKWNRDCSPVFIDRILLFYSYFTHILLLLLFYIICLILLARDWSLWVNNQDFIIGQAIEVIDEEVDLILQGRSILVYIIIHQVIN